MAAEPSALALAESRIVELSGQIQEQGALPDQLPWDVRKVVPASKKNTITVAVAVKALEVDFWKGKIRTTAAERTWERLKAETDRLPQQATLTMDLLVGVGDHLPDDLIELLLLPLISNLLEDGHPRIVVIRAG